MTNPKKIGLATATIVGMNAMIGAGIFSVPAALALNVGPAGILTYAFVIIAVYFMGTSLARLAQLFPEEGSFYAYASKWGGHILGLITTSAYLIGLIIAMGLLAQMIGNYLFDVVPYASAYTLGLMALLSLVVLNMVGVHLSQAGQMVLICTTVFPLLGIIAMCFFRGNPCNLTPFMPYGLTNVFAATKTAIFGFFGFEAAASLFNIVKNPQKNVSRALVYSISLVGILYLAFVFAIILAVPLGNFTSPEIPLTDTLGPLFPEHNWLIGIIHLSILSAMIGTVHSMIWSSSSLLVSYLKKFKNKKMKHLLASGIITDRIAVFIIGICIFITFATIKSIGLFFSFTALFIVFAYLMSMITLLTIQKEWKSKQNIKTLIGIATGLVILYFAAEGILLG